jgi:hypothetical protein
LVEGFAVRTEEWEFDRINRIGRIGKRQEGREDWLQKM